MCKHINKKNLISMQFAISMIDSTKVDMRVTLSECLLYFALFWQTSEPMIRLHFREYLLIKDAVSCHDI